MSEQRTSTEPRPEHATASGRSDGRPTVRHVRADGAGAQVSGQRFEGFRRRGRRRLEARRVLEEPDSRIGKLWRFLIGTPIHSDFESHERLTKKKALAVFSSDALSSVA
jgi:hypothetical protein